MKKFILLGLLSSLAFSDIKVDLMETKEIKIPELTTDYSGIKTFRILCINGYQWLHSGNGPTSTLSQMFTDNNTVKHAQPIMFKNKD